MDSQLPRGRGLDTPAIVDEENVLHGQRPADEAHVSSAGIHPARGITEATLSNQSGRPSKAQEKSIFLRKKINNFKVLLRKKSMTQWLLLILSCVAMMIAFPITSILTRLYFVDGATSKWILSLVAVVGWPIVAVILTAFCLAKKERPTPLTWRLTVWYIILGILTTADNLMFTWAYSYLPASTAALLGSSSLAFTAIIAYFLVGQRFNSSIINAVVFMTAATVILGLDSGTDRPFGVSQREYAIGFALDILASALHGLIFALSELIFIKELGRRSFRLVLEVQTATAMLAMIFTTVGVLIAGDFQKVHETARNFKHGPEAYYQVFVWSAIAFQVAILGSVGCLFLASTLLAGVLNAGRTPATTIAAVIIFNDPMGGFKILAVILTVWSFASYIWGSYEQQRAMEKKHRARQADSTSMRDVPD